MMEMGFRANRSLPRTPTYLLRHPADQSLTTYSTPKNTTSTISCKETKWCACLKDTQCQIRKTSLCSVWWWNARMFPMAILYYHWQPIMNLTAEILIRDTWLAQQEKNELAWLAAYLMKFRNQRQYLKRLLTRIQMWGNSHFLTLYFCKAYNISWVSWQQNLVQMWREWN